MLNQQGEMTMSDETQNIGSDDTADLSAVLGGLPPEDPPAPAPVVDLPEDYEAPEGDAERRATIKNVDWDAYPLKP